MTTPLPAEWDSWREEVARLLSVSPLRRNEISTRGPEDKKFLIGDVLAQVPARLVEALANELSEDASTLRSYREVAKKFPPERRVPAAWSVHRLLKDSPELIRPGLTVRDAAILAGRRPIDSKAVHRRTVEQRADDVRALLADPNVRAVIEAERHMSQEERRARAAARNVTSELDAEAKSLEVELRDARQAKKPYEATVKAVLDLHRAAQLADAVGQLITDLDQPERLAEALRTLISSATTALECYETPDDDVIVGEIWRARPEAYGSADSAQRSLPPMGRVINHAD
jgi:hypothetical protein